MRFAELSRAVLDDVAGCLARVNEGQVDRLVEDLARRREVLLVGSGRTGAVLRAMAVRLGHLGIEAWLSEAPERPRPARGTLVLAASGSGRTPATLKRTQEARRAGATVFAVTADPESPVAAAADHLIQIPAPLKGETGSPHTLRSLFEECLLILCDGVCRMLQERLGVSVEEMESRHSDVE